MKVVYASRTGNVESMIGKLGLADAVKIETGSEEVGEPFILITYTDGYGEVPAEVDAFLAGNAANLKGVIASGDTAYGDAFCKSGDVIAETYGCEHLYHFENDGTDEDVAAIAELIK